MYFASARIRRDTSLMRMNATPFLNANTQYKL
jgi:hypothetical protein